MSAKARKSRSGRASGTGRLFTSTAPKLCWFCQQFMMFEDGVLYCSECLRPAVPDHVISEVPLPDLGTLPLSLRLQE